MIDDQFGNEPFKALTCNINLNKDLKHVVARHFMPRDGD